MYITHRFSLDCQKIGSQKYIQGPVRGELNARRCVISLTQNGESISIPSDGSYVATVHITGQNDKPCTIENGNIVYAFQQSDFSTAGVKHFQLEILKSSSAGYQQVIYAPSFTVEIADSDAPSSSSSSQYTALQQALTQAQTYSNNTIEDITMDEDGQITIEFKDGHEKTLNALMPYISKEEDRQNTFDEWTSLISSWTSAEAERVSAENDRLDNESSRDDAEDSRLENEEERIENESARVSAETSRVSAEASRVSAEASRVSAESSRQTTFNNEIQTLEAFQTEIAGLVPTEEDQTKWNTQTAKLVDTQKNWIDYLKDIDECEVVGNDISQKLEHLDGKAAANASNITSLGSRVTTLENNPVSIATTSTAGKVKPDGSTITVDADGTIHSVGGGGDASIDDTTTSTTSTWSSSKISSEIASSGGSGTSNYTSLTNKPTINGVELVGNKTSADLNIGDAQYFDTETITIPNNNLLGFADGTYTKNGVTLTIADGVLTFDGTNTGTGTAEFSVTKISPNLTADSYYVMYEILEGTASTNALQFQWASGVNVVPQTINFATLKTLTATQNRTKFVAIAGSSFSNYKIHFWICKTKDEYVKYGEGGTSTTVTLHDDIVVPQVNSHADDTTLHFTSAEKSWINNQMANDTLFADEIADTVSKTFAETDEKCFTFAWLSDTHTYMSNDDSVKQYHSLLTHIKAVDKGVPFDCLVHCGDFVNTQWLWANNTMTDTAYQTTIKECANALRETGISDIFVPMGNHDGGYLGSNAEYSSNAINYKNVQRTYNKNGIVVRNGSDPWFYVDYPNLKLRCLFISTNINSSSSEIKGIHWNEACWLKTTLDSVGNDWNLLMFGHISFARFKTAMNRESTPAFINLVNAFNNHTSTGGSSSYVDSDFSSKSGKIIAYFCGHYHGDSIIEPTDARAVLNCPEISIAAGGYISHGVITTGDWYDSSDAPSRTLGTITEDVWDSVIVKLNSKEIKLIRFGAGSDREIDCSTY